jgi:branched-chain amino acid transport system substrate-binding protein
MKQGNGWQVTGRGMFILWVICLLLPLPVRAAEPYHLGVVLGLTGTGALYSRDGKNAIEMAVEEINKGGGFLGKHPIKLFVRDDQTKPDVGVREAKDLILREKVKCILGTYSSAVGLAVEDVCYEYKVLHIPAISNTEAMTVDNYSPYTYQVVPNTYMQAMGQVIGISKFAKQKGWKSYVSIGSDYEWGHSTVNYFVDNMKKTYPEFKLTKQYWPKLGETEFSSYITAVMGDKPDFVYAALASKDNIAWMKQAKPYGFFAKFPYACLISVTEMEEMKDELPRGVIGETRAPFFAHMDIPMMANFVKNYQAKYKQYPSDWAVMEYDAVYVLKQGVEKAQSIDIEKVKNALKGMTVDTTRGKLHFRKIDNMLNCQSYIGIIADDPKYPFPIYKDLLIITGEESWRPESEIPAVREKAGLGKKRKAEELKF